MSKNVKTALVIGSILLALAIVLYLLRKKLRIVPPTDNNGGNGGGDNGGNGGGDNGGNGGGGGDAPLQSADQQLLTMIQSAFGGPSPYNTYLVQKNVTEAQMLEKFKIRYDLVFRQGIINGMQSSHDIRVFVGRALAYNP